MPDDKIKAFLDLARDIHAKKAITHRELQSLVGHINHLGKAVPPARLFMTRIVGGLRVATRKWVKVDQQLKNDLNWFIDFLETYTGHSLIVVGNPKLVIEADSCMVRGGGWCGENCYTYRYLPQFIRGWSISELETYNCLLAARVLLKGVYNQAIKIVCDNNAAVMSLSSGSARDKNILAICRAFWFLSVQQNLQFIFQHSPGSQMIVADTLSRACLSYNNAEKARNMISDKNLKWVNVLPCHTDIVKYF